MAANARWLVGGFLLTLFSSFGQTFFIALSNGQIRSTFGLSHGEFGGLYMLATLGSAVTLPFIGKLLDSQRAWIIAAGTMSLLAVGAAVMAVAWSLPLLVLALYLLRLFGQGMMTQTAFTATGRWFAANRGRAISLVGIGHQVGEGLLPSLFVALVAALGWSQAWLASASLILIVALPLITLLIRVERSPRSSVKNSTGPAGRSWTRGEVLRDPLFWVLCLGVLAPGFIGTTIFFHQVYLTELRGWPLPLFAAGFAAMSATTLVFALIAGWLIDRFSAKRLLPSFLVPMALACFVAAYLTPSWAIFVFMVLLGISYGFSSTLAGAMWPEVYGTAHLGAIRSVVVAMMVLATAVGPGLTGYLIDIGIPYPHQLGAMGVYCLAAALLMLWVSRRLLRAGARSS